MTHHLNQLAPGAGVVGLIYGASRICLWTAHRLARRRQLRRTPAAPDNHAGRDIGLLQECRLIDATKPRKEKP